MQLKIGVVLIMRIKRQMMKPWTTQKIYIFWVHIKHPKGKYGSSQIEFLKRQRARNAKKQDS